MSEPVIEVRHLSKSFGTHVVLRDVDFTVNAGDVTCIIGASGSGKSTLLRCINLLETPTNGKVLFHGSDITAKGSDPCAYRAKVGMVFQSPDNQIVATVVEEDVAFALENLGVPPEEMRRRVDDAMKMAGIYEFRERAPPQPLGRPRSSASPLRASSPCVPTASSSTRPPPCSTLAAVSR